MKRIIFFLFTIIAFTSCKDKGTDLNKDISVPVSVMEIKLKTIQQFVSTTGTVMPVKTVSLNSEITGKYKLQINPKTGKRYSLGDKVQKGADIIILEDKAYENNIKIHSLELRMQISKQVYEKQQSLYKKGGVTLTDLKNAEIEYVNAQYSYEDAQYQLIKMHIKAPFTGVLTDLTYYTPNTKVAANAPMLTMMDYSNLYMEINLAEKNMDQIKVGQNVNIVNYTIPEDTLSGKLAQISPAINSETRSFKAVINIDNSRMMLRPGMFAKGEIVVASADSALVIPKDVILNKQRGNTVFIVKKGLAQERIIGFGLENAEEVQIVSGLAKKDRLVVKGFETLLDRSKVRVVK